jgi:NADH dehydrogenase/NADH:ubiquinone oxidoreductase subunit G
MVGITTLGLSARGTKTEIFDYAFIHNKVTQNRYLIGNIIDVCPVGWAA